MSLDRALADAASCRHLLSGSAVRGTQTTTGRPRASSPRVRSFLTFEPPCDAATTAVQTNLPVLVAQRGLPDRRSGLVNLASQRACFRKLGLYSSLSSCRAPAPATALTSQHCRSTFTAPGRLLLRVWWKLNWDDRIANGCCGAGARVEVCEAAFRTGSCSASHERAYLSSGSARLNIFSSTTRGEFSPARVFTSCPAFPPTRRRRV